MRLKIDKRGATVPTLLLAVVSFGFVPMASLVMRAQRTAERDEVEDQRHRFGLDFAKGTVRAVIRSERRAADRRWR